MNIVEIIRTKRNGERLTSQELSFIIEGYVQGKIPDYQMSAFLMAVFFQGMSKEETVELTRLMLHSGKTIDLSEIPRLKVDKHSTGGVGDKISLLLAPIVASCGVPVPMISGRGLGHTGGTLDKLEAIPGFRTSLSLDEYKKTITEIGAVMMGQTTDIAPADKKMYALRDVTATVESIPLIAGSIMSKKLAEGIDALVLDVKTGRGAFMSSYEQAVKLAETLVQIGTAFGKETIGFITSMEQPLGFAIGNWCEVLESVECLKGKNIQDIVELTCILGGAMVWLGKRASSLQEGIECCKTVITDGTAYKKFLQMVKKQGGNISYLENTSHYPSSVCIAEVHSSFSGFVTGIDALELGFSGIMLGAGRMTMNDVIDPKAGIMLSKKIGDTVTKGEKVATIFTDKENVVTSVQQRVEKAFTYSEKKPSLVPLVISQVSKSGVETFQG